MKKRTTTTALPAAALVLALALAGCGSTTEPSADPPATASASAGAPAGADSAQTRTVTDIDGTEVEVPANVERIADLWPADNQMMLLLGGQDALVATTQMNKDIAWFTQVYPRIAEIPAPVTGETGPDINMEELMAADPQVTIALDETMVENLRADGMPAVHVGFQNYDDLKRTIDITAEVIGTEDARDRAEQYTTYLDDNVALVREKLAGVSEADKPRVLKNFSAKDLTRIDGGDSFIGQWMDVAGGVNVFPAAANTENVTLEEVIATNPDVIIIGSPVSQEEVDALLADPAWQGVPAIANERVLRNPVGTFKWDRYSAETALQVLWAAKAFHPDLMADVDVAAEAQEFYRTFYDYDLSADEAQRMLADDGPAD